MEPDTITHPAPLPACFQLGDALGAAWPNITAARERAETAHARLRTHLTALIPEDTSLVVFGSLARAEFTDGSDVDWTLLVDGAADPDHWDRTQRIRTRIAELGLKQPTDGGSFGRLTISHDLIHKIGGDDDTNQNTTQRLLLLLESTPVGGRRSAYDRVVANVLKRYIEEDLRGRMDSPFRVPRFLLNDFGRYWRTMAVDFAHKRRVRQAEGWALRTTKLRLSRKLLYSAGLLTCYLCGRTFRPAAATQQWRDAQRVVDYLCQLAMQTPLDIVARAVLDSFGVDSGVGREIFDTYDEFLGLLNDRDKRRRLKALLPDDADADPVYQEARSLGHRFQHALTEMFFHERMREFTMNYGVF